ncbi:MAG: cysteine peptidase family C39 domain-containing protein, partial [Desulfobacterales bacterium]|nr:cysteine peptidase family C39 domain-containing protein [Desulfobacterales bacterium]
MAGLNLPGRKALPEIRANEVAECGLACMTMVARYHGHDLDLNGLRQRFPASMAGASLGTLIEMADDLGFSTRPLRLELEDLRDLQVPAILHWNMNHFVVLRKADRRGATIHDPARGVVRVGLEEMAESFTGV